MNKASAEGSMLVHLFAACIAEGTGMSSYS